MQELRLVGITDDGEHLLLTGDGERYKLPLNDELRATVRRDRRVTKAGAAATQPDSPLRPRDVQGLIRGGVPLEEIAERAGWSLEKVQRYEGPIRAERDYISERAQAVILPSRVETITLRERAAARLADRGVEAERVVWDSWKTDDIHWTVVVRFPAGGRLREATWLFDPVGHALRTVDDEARWLGGDELPAAGDDSPEATAKSAATARKRATARDGRREAVYDVESEGGVAEAQPPHLGAALSDDTGSLTASMRARQASRGRSQRRSSATSHATAVPGQGSAPDVTHVETLDLDTTPPPAPSHPRPESLGGSAAPGVQPAVNDESPATTPEVESTNAPQKGRGRKSGQNSGHPSTSAPRQSQTPAKPVATKPIAEVPAHPEEADAVEAVETELDPQEAAETTAIPVRSKRRGSRRSRSSSQRLSVREAIRGEDEDSDEGLFGELPGFHDDGGVTVSREASMHTDVDDDVRDDAHDVAVDDIDAEDFAADAESGANSGSEASKSGAAKEVPERASKARAGRPSVPSWDDIMFGGRGSKS